MPQIEFCDVVKDYLIRDRKGSRVKDFFRPKYTVKRAVNHISFSVEPGEMIGYIGPNGAGKSTTIKILTGILTTTGGEARVFGRDPCKNRRKNALRIGAVFGQRSQLLWDLPVKDTFELFKTMYRMDDTFYQKQRDMLIETLDMSAFLNQAVRQLSLGQRMRANLALCFLYNPEVVYLDEPTIGLDVLAKENLRRFLKQMNQEFATTILLTTHDTQDIEEVTQRLMLIDKGQMLFDGSQKAFREKYHGSEFLVEVEFAEPTEPIQHKFFTFKRMDGLRHYYLVSYAHMNHGEAITFIAGQYEVTNIQVCELSLEEILKHIYKGEQNK